MDFPLRNRFAGLDDMRRYFIGLVDKGDVVDVTKGVKIVNDLELIRGVMSDAETFKTFDFRNLLQILERNERLNLAFPELSESAGMWLMLMNGDSHLGVKKQMHQALYKQDLESIICYETKSILDGLEGRVEFDLMRDFCDPLISRIVCSIAGVDNEVFPFMKDTISKMQIAFEPYHTIEGIKRIALMERDLFGVLKDQAHKVSEDQPGMLAALNKHYPGSEADKAVAIIEFFFTAGIETSTLILCESIYRLMTDLKMHLPALYSESDSEGVVEELIRLSSGASMLVRQVQEEITMAGVGFKKGDSVYLNIAGANRDTRYFPYPDTIHPDNRRTKHLAFGTGRHHCVGANLSRLEMKMILPAFFERFKTGSLRPVPNGQVMRELYFTPGFLRLPLIVENPKYHEKAR